MTQNQNRMTLSPGVAPATPLSEEALKLFPQFVDRIRSRLEVGKAIYGDRSFTMPMADLADEICQELLDVAGWSFIQYARIQRLKQALDGVELDQDALQS